MIIEEKLRTARIVGLLPRLTDEDDVESAAPNPEDLPDDINKVLGIEQ